MDQTTHRCRPTGCPIPHYSDGCCDHGDAPCGTSSCGLRTYAASHAAALIPFVLGLIYAFWQFYQRQTESTEQYLAVFVGLTACVALVFYFFSFLIVEERHTWILRVLKPRAESP